MALQSGLRRPRKGGSGAVRVERPEQPGAGEIAGESLPTLGPVLRVISENKGAKIRRHNFINKISTSVC